MCGLAGELATGRRADLAAVERMAATTDDRGPDGAGAWAAGSVARAHRRLKGSFPVPALSLLQGAKLRQLALLELWVAGHGI